MHFSIRRLSDGPAAMVTGLVTASRPTSLT
jgi:hypothetical protein